MVPAVGYSNAPVILASPDPVRAIAAARVIA